MWVAMFKANQQPKSMYEQSVKGKHSVLSEPRLIDGLVPDFSVGCLRTTPVSWRLGTRSYVALITQTIKGLSFMQALKQPNVSVHFTLVTKIGLESPISAGGTSTKVDTIICATGFDTSYKPAFKLVV